jgi:hypothetical protein
LLAGGTRSPSQAGIAGVVAGDARPGGGVEVIASIAEAGATGIVEIESAIAGSTHCKFTAGHTDRIAFNTQHTHQIVIVAWRTHAQSGIDAGDPLGGGITVRTDRV